MKLLRTITLITLGTTLLLAAPINKQDARLAKTIKIGQKSSKTLLQTLSSKMKKNMSEGGKFKALEFCSDEAYSLTQQTNKKLPNGVKVKRISMKYRSPANAPKEDEIAILESFEALQKANVVLPRHLVQRVDAHTYKYYKPLVIKKKACLKCHGKVSKDVEFKRAIASRYPLDKAVNYEMGDLRGAVVVTVKYK